MSKGSVILLDDYSFSNSTSEQRIEINKWCEKEDFAYPTSANWAIMYDQIIFCEIYLNIYIYSQGFCFTNSMIPPFLIEIMWQSFARSNCGNHY